MTLWGVSENQGSFFGWVPIIRLVVHWGLYWGPPILATNIFVTGYILFCTGVLVANYPPPAVRLWTQLVILCLPCVGAILWWWYVMCSSTSPSRTSLRFSMVPRFVSWVEFYTVLVTECPYTRPRRNPGQKATFAKGVHGLR